MKLRELTGRRVCVLGLGIDTQAVLEHLVAATPASLIAAVDDPSAVAADVQTRLDELGIALTSTAALAVDVEVIVRSPGYPRYQPLVLAAEAAGATITTPTDLWLGEHAEGRTVLAVTGTKGKSSTTAAIGDLLRAAGRDVVVAGNIGVPVWAIEPAPGAIVVLEISSYQAVDVRTPPDIGVLTSLSSDHLSWHGGQEQYVRDKLSLFGAPGETSVLLVPLTESGALAAAAHLHPTAIDVHAPERDVVRSAASARGLAGPLVANLVLAVAASEAALEEQLPDELVRSVIAALQPLRGRHVTIAVRDNVRYVDDALATNPSAAAASLGGHEDEAVAMLLGGADRAVPMAPLLHAAAAHRGPLVLVALPDTGEALCEAVAEAASESASVTVLRADELADAVRLAAAQLRDGGLVLFAPSAPTPAHLGTWEDRSEQFRAAVAHLDD